jgi:anaerobic magnesium-protoporphyrin IX monomethyl ester cyclase
MWRNNKIIRKTYLCSKAIARESLSFVIPPPPQVKHQSKRLWLDLGELGVMVMPSGAQERWQDHGLGLLRTVLHQKGIKTDIVSTRLLFSWRQLYALVTGYDMLLMNVRSYTFPLACQAAKIFKKVNPSGIVIVGGMHASVALDEMMGIVDFDHICQGPAEAIIADIVSDPKSFPRLIKGKGEKAMADWPLMDRTLWPNPGRRSFPWPLEPECGFGPGPVATILTSRVCPWHCAFCNEASYIPMMRRKTVDQVIDELNYLHDAFGPIGSVIIHDSMFFQNPSWLKEWLEKYPRKAKKCWGYWAAARADTVRQWPDLFEALVKETNWNVISIGFESGSDRMLKVLNKECTADDNYYAINLLNRIGDEMERAGKPAPRFYSNIMLGIPGETHEDTFKTMRMLRETKRVIPSFAYYSPYPGSALGYQLIAEGRSLLSNKNYNRLANEKKVMDVDYRFYEDVLAGKYAEEIANVSL